MATMGKSKFSVDDLVGGPVKDVAKTASISVPEPVKKEAATVRVTAPSPIPTTVANATSTPNGGYVPNPTPSAPAGSSTTPYYNRGQFNGFNGYERPIPDANVPTEEMRGILDIQPEGHGFLRPKFVPSEKDIYISSSQIRKFNLKNG